MSKCKAVQDELKIEQLVLRKKEGGTLIQKRVLKANRDAYDGQVDAGTADATASVSDV